MSEDAFDLIAQAARANGANTALELLASIYRNDRDYSRLFQARMMQARHQAGLPLISPPSNFNPSFDDLSADQRQAFDEATRAAARETGSLYLAEGDIVQAWPYFRALGDPAPVAAAIEKMDANDPLDGILEIAFGEGVHPRKGFELLLGRFGICRAITLFQQYPDPKTRGQCAALLIRTLHRELIDNLKHAIARTEGNPPEGTSVPQLLRGRDWLFGDMDSYLDISHLTAVIPLALEFPEPEALQAALELCDYGAHLSPKLRFQTDPPFEDFYQDHAIYLRALAGRDVDAAMEHFQQKTEPPGGETAGAEALVMLLVRLKRYREAVEVALVHLGNRHPEELSCPAIPQLCQLAGDYDSLETVARRDRDLLNFTAAAIKK